MYIIFIKLKSNKASKIYCCSSGMSSWIEVARVLCKYSPDSTSPYIWIYASNKWRRNSGYASNNSSDGLYMIRCYLSTLRMKDLCTEYNNKVRWRRFLARFDPGGQDGCNHTKSAEYYNEALSWTWWRRAERWESLTIRELCLFFIRLYCSSSSQGPIWGIEAQRFPVVAPSVSACQLS